MTCRELEPLIIERAAGERASSESARLDAHLEGCERCRAELAGFQEALGLVRLPADEDRAQVLDASTLAAYQRRRRRRVTGLTVGAGFVAAAVAASVVLAPALLTLRSLPQQRPATHENASYLYAELPTSSALASSSDEVTVEDAAMAALEEAESP